jgi:hypothetical protein
VMLKPETWDSILQTMVSVREAHGWVEQSVISSQ